MSVIIPNEMATIIQLTSGTCRLLPELAKKQEGPSFAYFTASWCPDCNRSSPLLERAFSRRGGFTLFKIDVGEKAIFRDKSSAARTQLKAWELKCLPTVLYLGSRGEGGGARLDTALEQCHDTTVGLRMCEDFIDRSLNPRECPFPFILLHDPKAGLARHPLKIAGVVGIAAVIAMVLARR